MPQTSPSPAATHARRRASAPTRPRWIPWAAIAAALVLLGVGGIASAADAYAKIRAGACLLQLYTALVYRGPALVREIAQGLAELLRRDGFAGIEQARGVDAGKR